LHGELTKACNESKSIVFDIGYEDILPNDKAQDGSRLRPFIVWFGEAVPLIEEAARIVSTADILVIVGTSLQVYPAAGLVNYANPNIPVYLIDPNDVSTTRKNVRVIREKASLGMKFLQKELTKKV